MTRVDLRLIQEVVNQMMDESKETFQLYSRIIDLLEYLKGRKTAEFNYKMEKQYPLLKEIQKCEN